MQLRRSDRTVPLKFTGENIGVIFIIAQRFSVRSLVLLPKMASAGFVAGECIGAHELGELQKIGDAPGAFEGVVAVVAGAGIGAPELAAPHRLGARGGDSGSFRPYPPGRADPDPPASALGDVPARVLRPALGRGVAEQMAVRTD